MRMILDGAVILAFVVTVCMVAPYAADLLHSVQSYGSQLIDALLVRR